LFPALLFAEEGAGEPHEINWGQLTGQTVTFLIFVVGVVYFGRKAIAKYFTGRHAAVKTAVEEAQRAKAAAEQKFKEYQDKMQQFDVELQKLRDTMASQAKLERE